MAIMYACNNKPNPTSGEGLYKAQCANCHMASGEGLGQLMPPLKGTDYILENRDALACIIRNGMSGEIEVNGTSYNNQMKAFPELSEVDIVNILNYVHQQWYSKEPQFTLSEIRQQLQDCN